MPMGLCTALHHRQVLRTALGTQEAHLLLAFCKLCSDCKILGRITLDLSPHSSEPATGILGGQREWQFEEEQPH